MSSTSNYRELRSRESRASATSSASSACSTPPCRAACWTPSPGLGLAARLHADRSTPRAAPSSPRKLLRFRRSLGRHLRSGHRGARRRRRGRPPRLPRCCRSPRSTSTNHISRPARALIDRGVPVALGTDFNPGTSPRRTCSWYSRSPSSSSSSPQGGPRGDDHQRRAASASNRRTARSTNGKHADLVVWHVPTRSTLLPYWLGANLARAVVKRGRLIYEACRPPVPRRAARVENHDGRLVPAQWNEHGQLGVRLSLWTPISCKNRSSSAGGARPWPDGHRHDVLRVELGDEFGCRAAGWIRPMARTQRRRHPIPRAPPRLNRWPTSPRCATRASRRAPSRRRVQPALGALVLVAEVLHAGDQDVVDLVLAGESR